MARKNYNVRRDPFTGRFTTEANARALQVQFLEYAKEVKKNLQTEYLQIAEEFVKSIDRYSVPVYTGNMHDSVGVGLTVNGSVRKWHGSGGWKLSQKNDLNGIGTRIGTTRRITPRKLNSFDWKKKKGKFKMSNIKATTIEQSWGTFNGQIQAGKGTFVQFLRKVNENVNYHKISADVTIILFAAMPYSEPINKMESHVDFGWFNPLMDKFADQLEFGIKRAFLNTKPTVSGRVSGQYGNGKYSPFRYEINLRIRERLAWYKQ